jgi:hypothetical protein
MISLAAKIEHAATYDTFIIQGDSWSLLNDSMNPRKEVFDRYDLTT